MSLAVYREKALDQVPRILGLGDREEGSPTFGCFDRYFWHYRLHDFPNARFQEAARLLALLYGTPDTPYHENTRIRAWAEAAVRFWTESRHRNGSVDELHPNEQSFCATAFSAWSCCEAIERLALDVPADLERTAAWLAANDSGIANQRAAAALALEHLARLLGDDRWKEPARAHATGGIDSIDAEGCFVEYDGRDPGYHAVTLGLLLRLREPPADLARALPRARAYLAAVLADDGQLPAGRRGMRHLYPFALAKLAPDALERHADAVAAARAPHPGWLDDRYLIPLAADYLETATG